MTVAKRPSKWGRPYPNPVSCADLTTELRGISQALSHIFFSSLTHWPQHLDEPNQLVHIHQMFSAQLHPVKNCHAWKSSAVLPYLWWSLCCCVSSFYCSEQSSFLFLLFSTLSVCLCIYPIICWTHWNEPVFWGRICQPRDGCPPGFTLSSSLILL